MIKKIQMFIEDVKQEMAKVSWPTFPELRGSTSVVIVLCIILAIFLFIVDQSFTLIMKQLLK